jgi:hypothetical protein
MLGTPVPALVSKVVFGFLIALAGAVFAQILSGSINTKFLLHGTKKDGSRYFSPGRVQLLLFTLWTAGNYFVSAAQSAGRGVLPDVSQQTLLLLSGSHAVYLGGKAYFMLLMKQHIGKNEVRS